MNLLKLRALVALAACLAAPTVVGQELVEKVAVRNRLYTLDNRSELGLDVGLTMLARLTDHYNLSAHYAYNFSNAFALEARAGYALSKHTGLANQIAENFAADTKVKTGRTSPTCGRWAPTERWACGGRRSTESSL